MILNENLSIEYMNFIRPDLLSFRPALWAPEEKDLTQVMMCEYVGFKPDIREHINTFRSRVNAGQVLLGYHRDLCIGYVSWTRVSPDWESSARANNYVDSYTGTPYAQLITSMVILPHWRGYGFGAIMLDRAMEQCNDAAACVLKVHKDWTQAQAIYTSRGFELYGESTADWLLMSKVRP